MAAGVTGVYGSVEADDGMLLFSAQKRRDREAAEALYAACVAAARHPALYTAYGVPDTLQGRFEMLALHLFAPIQRLMHEPGDDPELARLLAERFVADMDAAFREMGVGDVTVPKRMKALYRSFAGRVSAYRTALGEGEAALVAAVSRNVFPDGEAEACALALDIALEAVRRGDPRSEPCGSAPRSGAVPGAGRSEPKGGGAMTRQPFSHPVSAGTIPADGKHFRLQADAEARRRLAEALGIPGGDVADGRAARCARFGAAPSACAGHCTQRWCRRTW